MRRIVVALLWCAWIVLSQHRSGDGGLWWRVEQGPVSETECRTVLKAISGRPKVAPSKWYDVTTQMLHETFGTVAVPTKGSWVTCWPDDVWDPVRSEPKWVTDQ